MPNSTQILGAHGGLASLLADYAGPLKDCFQYETIDYVATLDILDDDRSIAVFSRRQRLRFLDDDVGIFIDRVWGDGVIFAGYDPGDMEIVDMIRTSKGFAVVMQFPKRFRAGETFEVATERRIVGAFAGREAYWELTMPAPANAFTLRVLVPHKQRYTGLNVVAPNWGEFAVEQRSDSLELSVRSPALHIPYRLEWTWK